MEAFTRLKILVIDDDPFQAQFLGEYIIALKHNVLYTSDQEEALNMIKKENAKYIPFDLVFIDYKMPGSDGIELAEKIKALLPDALFAAITCYEDEKIINELCKAHIFDHIISKNKPQENVVHFLEMALSTKIAFLQPKES